MTKEEHEAAHERREELMARYPLLYGDRNKSMTQTAMCWGLDVGDGWLPLIEDLSIKLEAEIQKFLKENPMMDCECGHKWIEHRYLPLSDKIGGCTYIHKKTIFPTTRIRSYIIPKSPIKQFFQKGWKAFTWQIKTKFNRVMYWLAENTFLHKKQPCNCHDKLYHPMHPKASQVKEKFGGLRFYMTCSSDVMEKMIDEAEELALNTCETCSDPGELCSDYGWYKTLCESCMEDQNQTQDRGYKPVSQLKEEEDNDDSQ